jgi:precorrin-2 dehydrogenase
MTARSDVPYYPIFLSLKNRPCLVVGGGSVAAGKAKGLLAAGARIVLVSPSLTPELEQLATEGRIKHHPRMYESRDLKGMRLVMVTTNDPAVNATIAADCRARGIWVNAADDPPNCDFILPSVVRKGKVTLAASTSGASPALARRLREDLEAFLSEDLAGLADLLGEVRKEVQARGLSVSSERWQEAIDGRLRALLAQKRYGEAREHLLAGLGIELISPNSDARR